MAAEPVADLEPDDENEPEPYPEPFVPRSVQKLTRPEITDHSQKGKQEYEEACNELLRREIRKRNRRVRGVRRYED